MKRRDVLAGILGATAATTFGAARADNKNEDESLYDPAPPADSAYIRLIAGAAVEAITIGDAIFPAGDAARVEPYRILPAGQYDVAGAASGSVTLEAGSSYSYVAAGVGAPKLIKDDIVADAAKCGLMLYNLSDSVARLYVPGRNIEIVGDVATGAEKTRAVNAITVDLAVGAGEAEVAAFPEVKLRRRAHFTFVLSGSGGAYAAIMALNAVS